jgi:hypothetical protein
MFVVGLIAAPAAGWAAGQLRIPGAGSAYDVVVYGGTPSGVIAAVTAARAGVSVLLLEPTEHLGGMLANGLDSSDIGDKTSIGGYAKEFFDRIQATYKAQGIDTRWVFQAHVAERVFGEMLTDASVKVVLGASLLSTEKHGATVASVTTTRGTYAGRIFIDASYEGDLMAQAGVSYAVGRESEAEYGETLAGVRPPSKVLTMSGGVPSYLTAPPGAVGSADSRVQDANFTMCFSNAGDRVPFAQPAGYDRDLYQMTLDYLLAIKARQGSVDLTSILALYPLVRGEFEVNDKSFASAAVPGADWAWADGTPAVRQAIENWQATFDKGLVWFLASDPQVPQTIRAQMASYGWCASEWQDNDHFPLELYVREGRRMVGSYVMTQSDLDSGSVQSDSIAIGSYRIDSHGISSWAVDGTIYVEGVLYEPYRDYEIPYRSIVPKASESTNLLVTTCISASHVAWASLRMEPQLMAIGEAGGQAAAFAASRRVPVQDVDVSVVQAALEAHGAILDLPAHKASPKPIQSPAGPSL